MLYSVDSYMVSVLVLALKSNASTGGTDFIALYVSNKINRSIWEQVFIFNALILCIFGYMFGWIYAGYSIVFQFISTKTISTFHHRYERVTLQITTQDPENVVVTMLTISVMVSLVSRDMVGLVRKKMSY